MIFTVILNFYFIYQVINNFSFQGNTCLHYAISHGNFDIVSILMDSKVCNVNVINDAGYTCIMLVSLAQVKSMTHCDVIKRLFSMADVNMKAKQVSHKQSHVLIHLIPTLVEESSRNTLTNQKSNEATWNLTSMIFDVTWQFHFNFGSYGALRHRSSFFSKLQRPYSALALSLRFLLLWDSCLIHYTKMMKS